MKKYGIFVHPGKELTTPRNFPENSTKQTPPPQRDIFYKKFLSLVEITNVILKNRQC